MASPPILYWDSSAVLSLLIRDGHSHKAQQGFTAKGIHFLSSLVIAEVLGVLSRIPRDDVSAKKSEFLEDIEDGPWSLTHLGASYPLLDELSSKHRLRGADLWHLAAALELRRELAPLKMITFDKALAQAAKAEKVLFHQ